MPARIAALCATAGASAPTDPGALVRSILLSLACKYRMVLEQLEGVTGRVVPCVQVIGGGARDELLLRLTADLLDRPVKAGPVEASALGNVLVQGIALGELGSLADAHAVARASTAQRVYEPEGERDHVDAIYGRFLDLTASTQPVPIPTPNGKDMRVAQD